MKVSLIVASECMSPLFSQWLFDINETEMAIEAARETGLAVVACMTIGPLGDRNGVSPEECALRMARAGADVGRTAAYFDAPTSTDYL